jgi:hypothetical protein
MLLPPAQPTFSDQIQSSAGVTGYFGAETEDLSQRVEPMVAGFPYQLP